MTLEAKASPLFLPPPKDTSSRCLSAEPRPPGPRPPRPRSPPFPPQPQPLGESLTKPPFSTETLPRGNLTCDLPSVHFKCTQEVEFSLILQMQAFPKFKSPPTAPGPLPPGQAPWQRWHSVWVWTPLPASHFLSVPDSRGGTAVSPSQEETPGWGAHGAAQERPERLSPGQGRRRPRGSGRTHRSSRRRSGGCKSGAGWIPGPST